MAEPDRVAFGAALVIFDSAGRVLLVHHTYGPLNWELPGGVAEPGEDPASAARRELRIAFEADSRWHTTLQHLVDARWENLTPELVATLDD